MIKYSESWKALMAYIWRTWRLEPVDDGDEDQREEGEEDEGGEDDDGAGLLAPGA